MKQSRARLGGVIVDGSAIDVYGDIIAIHYGESQNISIAKKAGYAADLSAAAYDGKHTYVDRGDPMSHAVERLDGDHIIAVYDGPEIWYAPDLFGENVGSLVVEVNGNRRWLRTANSLREITGLVLEE